MQGGVAAGVDDTIISDQRCPIAVDRDSRTAGTLQLSACRAFTIHRWTQIDTVGRVAWQKIVLLALRSFLSPQQHTQSPAQA